MLFQLTAARRRLDGLKQAANPVRQFQLTAARRRLENAYVTTGRTIRFNSQPPEGGWALLV